ALRTERVEADEGQTRLIRAHGVPNAAHGRGEQIFRQAVEQRDDAERDEKKYRRIGGVETSERRANDDDGDADNAVRGAELARVVDGLGRHLRQTERDQREVNALRTQGDETAEIADHRRCRQHCARGQPERRRDFFQQQCGNVGAETEIERLTERQQADNSEQQVDRQREAAEDQRFRGETEEERVARHQADDEQNRRRREQDIFGTAYYAPGGVSHS